MVLFHNAVMFLPMDNNCSHIFAEILSLVKFLYYGIINSQSKDDKKFYLSKNRHTFNEYYIINGSILEYKSRKISQ